MNIKPISQKIFLNTIKYTNKVDLKLSKSAAGRFFINQRKHLAVQSSIMGILELFAQNPNLKAQELLTFKFIADIFEKVLSKKKLTIKHNMLNPFAYINDSVSYLKKLVIKK